MAPPVSGSSPGSASGSRGSSFFSWFGWWGDRRAWTRERLTLTRETLVESAPSRAAESDEKFYTFEINEPIAPSTPNVRARRPTSKPVSNPCALVIREVTEFAASSPQTRPRALTPVSEVVVRENEHRDRAVGYAVAREHERLAKSGRLYTVAFRGERLGLSLVLARLSDSARSRLVVDATSADGACYRHVRPLDELVAINGEKLIPIEMEAFPTLIYRLQHAARPVRLTFARGYGRDAAFREQTRRRSIKLVASLPSGPGPQPRAAGDWSPAATPTSSPTISPTATASMQTSTSHVDLREPDAGRRAARVVVLEIVDCGCFAGFLGDFGAPYSEPCSACTPDGPLFSDGLCQWDIDQSGEGEVYTRPERV